MTEGSPTLEKFEALLIQTLADSGWKKTYRGERLGKADFEFNNGKVTLQIQAGTEPGWIGFSIFKSAEEGSDFAIHCPNKLAAVLTTVISFQDKISFDNYKQFLSDLVAACPEIYVDTGDDLVPLVDEDRDA